MKNIVSLKDIVVTFDGETILNNISLDIKDKEFTTLLGPSGCGKTTTLRIIGGFIDPDSGTINFEGKNINNLPSYKRNVNTVFQRYALFPHLNVYENIAFGLRVKKMDEKEIRKRVGEMLELVNLRGFEKRNISRLSGGQQQRVAIARALVNQPKVLLLDEPTTHLDLSARELLQQALCDFPGTVCIVSHDIEFVRNVATTILALEPEGVKKYYGNYDYYLEKSASLIPAAVQVRSDGAPVQDSAKLRRQERARARQAIQGELKKAKDAVAKLEKLYDELSDRKTFLVAKLSGGGKVDFAALKKELAEVEAALAKCETDWEEAAMELEALKLENDRIHSN